MASRREGSRCQVCAALLVLKPQATLAKAIDMLYRREIGRVGSSESYDPSAVGRNRVQVGRLDGFLGIATVLYTSIPDNITPLTPKELARRAIESARGTAGAEQQDGITYLRRAIENGIETPMTSDYVNEILEITGTTDLCAAWAGVRRGAHSK